MLARVRVIGLASNIAYPSPDVLTCIFYGVPFHSHLNPISTGNHRILDSFSLIPNHNYRICPDTVQICPNRCALLCSNKRHITSNSHLLTDKTSKDHPKTLKFERYSGLFSCRTCANRQFHAVVNRAGPCSSYLPYICIS